MAKGVRQAGPLWRSPPSARCPEPPPGATLSPTQDPCEAPLQVLTLRRHTGPRDGCTASGRNFQRFLRTRAGGTRRPSRPASRPRSGPTARGWRSPPRARAQQYDGPGGLARQMAADLQVVLGALRDGGRRARGHEDGPRARALDDGELLLAGGPDAGEALRRAAPGAPQLIGAHPADNAPAGPGTSARRTGRGRGGAACAHRPPGRRRPRDGAAEAPKAGVRGLGIGVRTAATTARHGYGTAAESAFPPRGPTVLEDPRHVAARLRSPTGPRGENMCGHGRRARGGPTRRKQTRWQ